MYSSVACTAVPLSCEKMHGEKYKEEEGWWKKEMKGNDFPFEIQKTIMAWLVEGDGGG